MALRIHAETSAAAGVRQADATREGAGEQPGSSPRHAAGSERETVILVHGLWMSPWVMGVLARRLGARGYSVHVFGYRSVRDGLAANADALARFAAGICAPAVHFVGHSLGGLVIAASLHAHPDPRPGRVVFVGSPFRGSAAALRLARSRAGAAVLGRSMAQWLHTPGAWTPGREIGVIAGEAGLGLGRLIEPALGRPNDGAVAVEETQVPGAKDRIVLPVSHSGMLLSRQVAEQVAHFLREGHFRPPE
ncbi:MAG: alpha/beta hydrolase [Rhodocyclaceae bacterium]